MGIRGRDGFGRIQQGKGLVNIERARMMPFLTRIAHCDGHIFAH